MSSITFSHFLITLGAKLSNRVQAILAADHATPWTLVIHFIALERDFFVAKKAVANDFKLAHDPFRVVTDMFHVKL